MALEAPLGEQLETMRVALRYLRPTAATAYDELVARLAEARMGSGAPRVGEPMPEFVLPDEDGGLVSLEALRSRGPVVVSFNRGHWCPYCRLEVRALARAEPAIAALGASLISIVPERTEFARKLRPEERSTFPILTDIDLGYALNLGLTIWIGEKIDRLYRSEGVALDIYQGREGSFLPLPATFVVGSDGLVMAAFIDPDFRHRMPVEDVLAVLAAPRS